MSRKLKNIIITILLVILAISMYFTITYSNTTIKNNNNIQQPPQMDFNTLQKSETGGNMIEPPAKPDGSENQIQPENSNEMIKPVQNRPQDMNMNFVRTNSKLNILLIIKSLAISLLIVYLVMSNFNKKAFKETLTITNNNLLIYILLVIILTSLISVLTIYFSNNNRSMRNGMMEEPETEKTTTAENVDAGESITTKNINLNDYTSNVTITETGNYTLTGSFGYSVLINADSEVTLNLDNVTIKNNITAAIANISTNSLIINLPENTNNSLTDGGSSEYDGCIFSTGPLTITGSGNLDVYGKQEEGEGIATDTNDITINGGNINIESNDDGLNAGGDGGTITINDGTIFIKASGDGIDSNKNVVINGGNIYTMGSSLGGDAGMDADEGITINGGSVIALGSDMLEKPLSTSKQSSLSFNLSSTVTNGSTIILKDENNNEVTTFKAKENFKTLIISNDKLTSGTYYLYNGNEKIAELNIN